MRAGGVQAKGKLERHRGPPAEVSSLVGRGPQVAAILDGLRTARVVTLTGPGGCGNADQSRVDAFAGMFTSAPRVDAALARGVGHNIDHHHLGRALQLQQLAFSLTCTPVPVLA